MSKPWPKLNGMNPTIPVATRTIIIATITQWLKVACFALIFAPKEV